MSDLDDAKEHGRRAGANAPPLTRAQLQHAAATLGLELTFPESDKPTDEQRPDPDMTDTADTDTARYQANDGYGQPGTYTGADEYGNEWHDSVPLP